MLCCVACASLLRSSRHLDRVRSLRYTESVRLGSGKGRREAKIGYEFLFRPVVPWKIDAPVDQMYVRFA